MGQMWESTPDRRPGWAVVTSCLPHSRPIYLIDAVDSGRSQRCPDPFRHAPVEHRAAADMWWRFRFGPVEQPDHTLTLGPIAKARIEKGEAKPWDDLQFPLEHFDR